MHRDQGERQVNVLEHEMLDQLGSAVESITLTPELVREIVKGLNETHREAMAQKARSAEVYRAEIRALEEKEDRLFDRYDRTEIDRATSERQLERVRGDKADRFEKLREADSEMDERYLVTTERVLELAKNARALWERRSDEEKRDLLSKLVCNPRLEGRTFVMTYKSTSPRWPRCAAKGDGVPTWTSLELRASISRPPDQRRPDLPSMGTAADASRFTVECGHGG